MANPDTPQSDLSRAITHEPNQDWPHIVEIRVGWMDKSGRVTFRTETITAAEFFGLHGAPISGERIVASIERMRRLGEPKKKAK